MTKIANTLKRKAFQNCVVKILIENKYPWWLSWNTGQDPHSGLDPQWLGVCFQTSLCLGWLSMPLFSCYKWAHVNAKFWRCAFVGYSSFSYSISLWVSNIYAFFLFFLPCLQLLKSTSVTNDAQASIGG